MLRNFSRVLFTVSFCVAYWIAVVDRNFTHEIAIVLAYGAVALIADQLDEVIKLLQPPKETKK